MAQVAVKFHVSNGDKTVEPCVGDGLDERVKAIPFHSIFQFLPLLGHGAWKGTIPDDHDITFFPLGQTLVILGGNRRIGRVTAVLTPLMAGVYVLGADVILALNAEAVLPTLALIVVTAVVGASIVQRQGLGVLRRAEARMRANEPPVAELFDGLCIFFAGALLLTPGFVTDSVGALLLVPPVRRWLLGLIGSRFATRGSYASFGFSNGSGWPCCSPNLKT